MPKIPLQDSYAASAGTFTRDVTGSGTFANSVGQAVPDESTFGLAIVFCDGGGKSKPFATPMIATPLDSSVFCQTCRAKPHDFCSDTHDEVVHPRANVKIAQTKIMLELQPAIRS